jgi:hypothetical protein
VKKRAAAGIGVILGAVAGGMTALTFSGSHGTATPPKPSVAACTKAYPAWFAASAAQQKTAPTPAACQGLTQDQVAAIAASYLASHPA